MITVLFLLVRLANTTKVYYDKNKCSLSVISVFSIESPVVISGIYLSGLIPDSHFLYDHHNKHKRGADVEFGEFLKMKRQAKQMSLRQLALYAGCSDAYLSMLERGIVGGRGPSPSFLRKLVKPLGVPFEVLMSAAGYHLQTGDSLYSGSLLVVLRHALGDDAEQFAKRVDLSVHEVETLEKKGVSHETMDEIFDRLFRKQRELTPVQVEIFQRMEEKFYHLPSDLSVKMERLLCACLDIVE